MREETIQSRRDISIFVRSWPSTVTPRGIVVMVHGLKSHGGLYEWPAQELSARGFTCYAPDLRGHGRSGGERLHVDDFTDWVADVDATVTLARARGDGLPLFVLGHSAGGVISASWVVENQERVAGFICESFAQEVPVPGFAVKMLKGIESVAPNLHVYRLKDEYFSRDPAFVERMKHDRLIDRRGYPAHTVVEIVRADERLRQAFPRFALPLLVIHGTADKVTVPHGSKRFVDEAGSKDKTLRLYEDHAHDLLNDVGKERVLADITEWMEMHTRMRVEGRA